MPDDQLDEVTSPKGAEGQSNTPTKAPPNLNDLSATPNAKGVTQLGIIRRGVRRLLQRVGILGVAKGALNARAKASVAGSSSERQTEPREHMEQVAASLAIQSQTRAVNPMASTFPGLKCSRGLDAREIRTGQFVIVDAFGCTTLPFQARSHEAVLQELATRAHIVPLTHADGSLLLEPSHPLDGVNIPWSLEEPYVARIPDAYRIWLCGRGSHHMFDAAHGLLPLAYMESGYGHGDRAMFEEIHTEMLKGTWPASKLITPEMLFAYLHHYQLKRICDDILALISRATHSFQRMLEAMRAAVRANAHSLALLGARELVHSGNHSYEIATQATVAVISLTSSLDIATKLIAFINDTKLPPTKFRGASGKYYVELNTLKPGTLPLMILDQIRSVWSGLPSIPELVQFRHDLIHSTTALEVERTLYIGFATGEINELPLHYAQMPWRDIDANGQPLRYLGRDFFTFQGRDLDVALHRWLSDVIRGHAETARILLGFINEGRANPQHHLPGT